MYRPHERLLIAVFALISGAAYHVMSWSMDVHIWAKNRRSAIILKPIKNLKFTKCHPSPKQQ